MAEEIVLCKIFIEYCLGAKDKEECPVGSMCVPNFEAILCPKIFLALSLSPSRPFLLLLFSATAAVVSFCLALLLQWQGYEGQKIQWWGKKRGKGQFCQQQNNIFADLGE